MMLDSPVAITAILLIVIDVPLLILIHSRQVRQVQDLRKQRWRKAQDRAEGSAYRFLAHVRVPKQVSLEEPVNRIQEELR